MKRLRFWAATAVIMLIGSCTAENQPSNQEVVEPRKPQVVEKELVISAYSSDDSSTKSARGSNGTFLWSPGDEISVFCGSGDKGGARFSSNISVPTEIVDFQGTITIPEGEEIHDYWGIYPYNVINSCDGQKLITEIPSRQVAAEGTFADRQFISIGHSNELSMGFYHLCGGIKFKLGTEGISQVVLKGNKKETLAGIVEVTIDEDNHPIVTGVSEPKYEIVLTPPANAKYFSTGVEYYFVLMPVEFQEGFTIAFETDTAVGERVVRTSMTVNRAKFQWSNSVLDTGVSFSQINISQPNIIPSAVQNYIQKANTEYPGDTGYTKTYVSRYSGSDEPAPVTISWEGNDADKVLVSTSPFFYDTLDEANIKYSSSGESASIYNLTPGVLYYYRVERSDGSSLKEGFVRPVGPLRMIYGVADNFRDLGGWNAENNKTIRYGRLYRGAHIDDLAAEDYKKNKDIFFNTLNMGFDMDLRGYAGSSTSAENQVFPEDVIEFQSFPVRKYFGYGTTDGYTQAAIDDEDLYRDAIKATIDFLGRSDKALYFHCSAGADRTGVLAFLIEALLGVSESDMSIDYELTTYSGQTRQRTYTTSTSKYPYKTMILHLREKYSGSTMQEKVTAWAKDGSRPLTDSDIARLKALMLE